MFPAHRAECSGHYKGPLFFLHRRGCLTVLKFCKSSINIIILQPEPAPEPEPVEEKKEEEPKKEETTEKEEKKEEEKEKADEKKEEKEKVFRLQDYNSFAIKCFKTYGLKGKL